MSIWADINRRSQGLQKRKEDIPSPEPKQEENAWDHTWKQWDTYIDDSIDDPSSLWYSHSGEKYMGGYAKNLHNMWNDLKKKYYSLDDDL